MLSWTQGVVERRLGMDLEMDDMAEVDQLDETDDDAYFAARRKVWEDQYRAEGREQAREARTSKPARKPARKPVPVSAHAFTGWPRGGSVRSPRIHSPRSSKASTTPSV